MKRRHHQAVTTTHTKGKKRERQEKKRNEVARTAVDGPWLRTSKDYRDIKYNT